MQNASRAADATDGKAGKWGNVTSSGALAKFRRLIYMQTGLGLPATMQLIATELKSGKETFSNSFLMRPM